MRAVRFERDGTVKFVQAPNPQPGPEDVLVQVLAAGVCHTDLHLLDRVKAGKHDPLIPGHEIAGRVVKVGSDVYASNVGDRVVVHFEQPCGQCRQCKRMRTNLCAIQIARVQGARVLGVEVREEARKAALDSGAEQAVPPNRAASAVREIAGAQCADVSIDFVGTKATFDLGRFVLGSGGRFVAVALGSEAVSVTADDLIDGGKSYLGAYSSTMADLARAIALAEAGRLRPVVARKVPLSEAATVLNDLRDGKVVGRAVLFPGPMEP